MNTEFPAHAFRLARPQRSVVRETERTFLKEQSAEFKRWADYRTHQNVVENALTKHLYGEIPLTRDLEVSLKALRESLADRQVPIRGGGVAGPPVFQVHPGLNVVGPPYDFGLNVALGSNTPAVFTNVADGSFGLSMSASDGNNSFGSAGVALFVVPSDPAKTLLIRPYFTWEYTFSCESHGSPTAHAVANVSASVSGRINGATKPFPDRGANLFSAGSDAWDDAKGSDAGAFVGLDSQLVASGCDYYVVSFVGQGSVDANGALWMWAASYLQLHCRVGFVVIEEI